MRLQRDAIRRLLVLFVRPKSVFLLRWRRIEGNHESPRMHPRMSIHGLLLQCLSRQRSKIPRERVFGNASRKVAWCDQQIKLGRPSHGLNDFAISIGQWRCGSVVRIPESYVQGKQFWKPVVVLSKVESTLEIWIQSTLCSFTLFRIDASTT